MSSLKSELLSQRWGWAGGKSSAQDDIWLPRQPLAPSADFYTWGLWLSRWNEHNHIKSSMIISWESVQEGHICVSSNVFPYRWANDTFRLMLQQNTLKTSPRTSNMAHKKLQNQHCWKAQESFANIQKNKRSLELLPKSQEGHLPGSQAFNLLFFNYLTFLSAIL